MKNIKNMKDHIQLLEQRYFSQELTDQEKTLTAVFFIFAFCEEDLPSKLIEYILRGDQCDPVQNLNLLQHLKSTDELHYPILLQDVPLYGYIAKSEQQKNDANLLEASLKRSYEARDKIFTGWTDFLTRAQLIRFGQVLAVLPRNFMFDGESPIAIPRWLLALIHHCGDAYQNWHSFSHKKINFKTKRPKITLESLADLLEEVGLDRNIIFDLLGDTNLGYDPVCLYNTREIVTQFVGFESTILKNKEAVLERFHQLRNRDMQLAQVRFFMDFPNLAKAMEDFVIQLVLTKSKTVAKESFPFLASLDNGHALQKLNHYLVNGNAWEREKSAELLLFVKGSAPYLEAALVTEKSQSIRIRIQTSLSNLKSVAGVAAEEPPSLAPFVPQKIHKLVKEDAVKVLQQNLAELLAKTKAALIKAQHSGTTSEWQALLLKDYEQFTDQDLAAIADYINGDLEKNDATFRKSFFLKHRTADLITLFCFYNKRMLTLKGYSLYHVVRTLRLEDDELFYIFRFPELYRDLDLRQVLYELEEADPKGDNARHIGQQYLASFEYSDLVQHIKAEHVCPFFTEHLHFIEEGLGLIQESDDEDFYTFETKDTLQTLNYFSMIPTAFIPKLLEFSLGDGKTLRPLAQHILSKVPNIHLRAEDALGSSKQEIRRTAIEWLAELNQPSSVKALSTLLKKEKNELVRATLLTALESLGEDVSHYLSPDVLLQEAKKGLSAKISTSFTWFDRHQLPVCQWHNGDNVNPDIIYYWIVLAVKLKLPEGNGLFKRYLSLLAQKSQQALGDVLLRAFIVQDTISLTEEEALAIAKQEAPSQLAQYHAWGKQYANEAWAEKYRRVTLEEVIADIKREKLGQYLGSAIKDKGMLAFISGIEAQLAVTMVMRFMKEHYKRRAQIEAILIALAESENPLVIQLILSIARRHRTNSVQLLAKQLVDNIGARNGWSRNELADRTIPTANIEDDGKLLLDYGGRVFTAELNEKQALSLFSTEGKEIKALPEARKDEDAELVKDAKKQFSSRKKELKQIITQQSERLFEAMCIQRKWPMDDWHMYYASHPIMKRLIERLVWLNVKEDGTMIQLFRPTEDGVLISAEDEEITLVGESYVMLTHSALLDANTVKTWQAHLKDYQVTALFPQFDNGIPEIERLQNNEILDRQGWVTDTFTLRNIMHKLGYQRGEAPDEGFFDYYSKKFESLDCEIVICFSGNYLPEENVTAVLLGLNFHSSTAQLAMDEIPPILLAEGYGDYLKVAKTCTGFDPEWEKKMPW